MLLYYITDRKQLPGSDVEQRDRLLDRVAKAARAGVDYIHLREKDLSTRELEQLAVEALSRVRAAGSTAKLLINSRTDIALAAGLDGVHLTSTDLAASEPRAIYAASLRATSSARQAFTVAVSCHSVHEVKAAESYGADFVVLAPIFEKATADRQGIGLDTIRLAVNATPLDTRVEAGDQRGRVPVLALGGVTLANAASCVRAGAAGVAGIRIFQDGDISETVKTLRSVV